MAEAKTMIAVPKIVDKGAAVKYELLELVLCKDCWKKGKGYCPFFLNYRGAKYDDWFCADGEKVRTKTEKV